MQIIRIIIFLLSASVYGSQKESITLQSRDVGMFSVFIDVVTCLHAYDQQLIKGFTVDFKDKGLYYDPQIGDNWWSYYFEPIALGDLAPPIRTIEIAGEFLFDFKKPYPKHHEIISQYIFPKSQITQFVNHFVNENFKGYTIGIHYRGTDKKTEAPRIAYSRILELIQFKVSRLKSKPYTLFVATDEQAFLDEIIRLFPGHVRFIEAQRATNITTPVHYHPNRNPFQLGLTALIDCLLLSKTHLLIRTASNLSECSRYFNPDLPTILVGER
jgi:hypothetical protein